MSSLNQHDGISRTWCLKLVERLFKPSPSAGGQSRISVLLLGFYVAEPAATSVQTYRRMCSLQQVWWPTLMADTSSCCTLTQNLHKASNPYSVLKSHKWSRRNDLLVYFLLLQTGLDPILLGPVLFMEGGLQGEVWARPSDPQTALTFHQKVSTDLRAQIPDALWQAAVLGTQEDVFHLH